MIAPATHSHGCSRHRDGCSACFSDGPTEEQLRQRCLCVFPFRPPVWLIVTCWTLITVNWWPVVLRGSTLNLRPWLLFVFCSLPIQVPLKVWLDTDLILFSRQICTRLSAPIRLKMDFFFSQTNLEEELWEFHRDFWPVFVSVCSVYVTATYTAIRLYTADMFPQKRGRISWWYYHLVIPWLFSSENFRWTQ